MTCHPNSVRTGPTTAPFSPSKAASSNSRTIWPLPNHPRSPPFFLDGQSLNCVASAEKLSPDLIFSIISFAFGLALHEYVRGVHFGHHVIYHILPVDK